MVKPEEVELCNCGHEAYHHKLDHNGILGYCRDYLYGDFEMKCTCQQFNPLMTLTDSHDIYDLTDDGSFTPTDESDYFE